MGVFQALVFLIFQEGVEVDGQGVVAGDGLGSGTDNAGVGAAGLQVGGRHVGGGFLRGVRGVGLYAEKQPADLQLGLSADAEVLHLQLRGGGPVVDVPQGEHPAPAQQHQSHGDQLDRGGHDRPAQTQASACVMAVRDDSRPEDPGQHCGGSHHGDGEPAGQHIAHRRLAEGLGHHGHFGQGEDGEEGLEHMEIYQLSADPQGDQGGTRRQEEPAPLW